jgi:dTDP-4-amino-4,6-dideoxygalactose transaminase
LFGQPANMTALRAIAIKHKLKIVEDAAQAHGAVWESGPVGSLGNAAGFSFQSSKNLASGEGGALTTNDERVFDLAYSMQNAGRSRTKAERWEHVTLGWNCRITEYQAGLLMSRLGYFDSQQTTRRDNFQYLRNVLTNVDSCLQPLALHPGVKAHGMYMFALRYVDAHCGGLPIDNFLELVQAEGVPIYRSFTSTLSEQTAIRNLNKKHPEYFRRLPTPVADQAINSIAYIPQEVFLGSTNDMNDIIAAIRKVERYSATRSISLPATPRSHVSLLELQT